MKKKLINGVEYVVLMLDKSAQSFCYYNHDYVESELMSLNTLKKSISFCSENHIHASILYGNNVLPDAYTSVLKSFPHIRIKAYHEHDVYQEDDIISILFSGDYAPLENLPDNLNRNIILRLKLSEVKSLSGILHQYYTKFKRLNIFFIDILTASEEVLNNFRLDLQHIQRTLFNELWQGKTIEVSLATDRLLLKQMNNCNAGLTHFTIAPNGEAYLCPGFYYTDPQNSIGSIYEEIIIKNQQLLQIDHAPVCKICDSYQCKRCVYMNQLSTLEVNTPSYQQCIVSHHERNLTGSLLNKLHLRNLLTDIPEVPALYYLDPFEIIKDN